MAQRAFEVPLIPARSQRLRVALSGVEYTLALNWNKASNCWVLDIYDAAGTTPLLRGIPLITGANLLDQFPYVEPGATGGLLVMTIGPGHSPDEVPTFDDLGVDGHLYYVTFA